MRKAINRIGGMLILLVAVCLLWGAIAYNVRETFNERRKVILNQCEKAMPILTRRYQSFIPLFQMCEKQDTWDSDFVLPGPRFNEPPPAWAPVEPPHVDLSGGMDGGLVEGLDLRRFTGGTIDTNAGVYVIVDFTAVHDGITRFTNGTTAFEKVMGATEIEHNLPQIIAAATNFDTINTNLLMRQLQTDLAATASDATAAISAVSKSVAQYNTDISHSSIAKLLQIEPIGILSKLVTWDEGHAPQ